MLLLVFHSYGCHLNASPNEPRPDVHQLHDTFWAAMHNTAGIIRPPVHSWGRGKLCVYHQALPVLTLVTFYLPAPTVVSSTHTSFWPQFLLLTTSESLSLPTLCLWQVSTFLPSLIHQTRMLLSSELCLALIFKHMTPLFCM